jgi:hypothetical protein
VRENALVLSVLAQFNGQVSKEVVEWFNQLRFTSGLTDQGHFAFTAERLKDPAIRQKLLSFAQKADFNIDGLFSEFQELLPETIPPLILESVKASLPPNTKTLLTPKITTSHPRTGADDHPSGSVQFDMEEKESQGTQKFISISGPLHHTIEEGSILVIDEFEARLHPLLTRAIFEWFHSAANHGTAQLIVATHDVGLMDPEFLRRDQVWFCEKNNQGATSLYSLAEFDSNIVRPTTKFSRQYLLGLFGSVPKLALMKEVSCG